jgi:excisionase family DNA binding protein
LPETLDFRDPEWVADQLNIDKNAVYRYLNEGYLPGIQLGRKWLISESSLAEFLKSEERRQTQERRLAVENEGFTLGTERMRRALRAARDHARDRNHNYIGTEHLLWAVTSDSTCLAACVLDAIGVDRQVLLAEIARIVPDGTEPVTSEIGLTPRGKKALDLAVKQAGTLNHSYVGTEHLLLGLLEEGDGISAKLLQAQNLTLEALRTCTLRLTAEFVKAAQTPKPDGPS